MGTGNGASARCPVWAREEDWNAAQAGEAAQCVLRLSERLHAPPLDDRDVGGLLDVLVEELHVSAAALYVASGGSDPALRAVRGIPVELCRHLASAECEQRIQPIAAAGRHGLYGRIRLEVPEFGLLDLFLAEPRPVAAGAWPLLHAAARQLALALRSREHLDALMRRLEQPQLAAASDSIDPLTGLYDSHRFHALLEAEVERVRRHGGDVSLLLLDLDDFQHFNRAYGVSEGDRLLVRVGQILLASLRKVDVACRYGGEEFVLILPGCDDAGLSLLAERIHGELCGQPFPLQDGRTVHVGASIGAVCYRPHLSIQNFIGVVDQALQRAKLSGKNRVNLGPAR
jgi:diguanylate cyclase (GGDEF)-like protein